MVVLQVCPEKRASKEKGEELKKRNSLSLFAVQKINPGVASILMAITPIILIPYSMLIKKEKVYLKEIIGTVVAILGVTIIFI